jgi:hypothetical protein
MARRLFLCLMLALALVGCTKTETTVTETATTDTSVPADTMPVDTATVMPDTAMTTDTSALTTDTSSTTSTSTASAITIGVAECDNYLTKLNACVTTKMPAEARAQWESTLNQTRSSWQQLSANAQTRSSLAAACQSATDMARTSLQTYGCEF